MDSNLIIIRQLPEIEEHLAQWQGRIRERIADALRMACTPETVKSIKKERAALNKEKSEFEARRKEVKAAILAPYERFEGVYKTCITDQYNEGLQILDARVAEIEDDIKAERRKEAEQYFDEYAQSLGIDFVTFDDAGIKVGLSGSKKGLMDAVKIFLDRIHEDLLLIATQPDDMQAEILVEYKRSLSVSQAIRTVTERKKAIEQEQFARIAAEQQQEEQQAAVQKVDAVLVQEAQAQERQDVFHAPVEQLQAYDVAFRYRTTNLDSIRQIRDIMKENGEYEQL